MRLLHTSDWHIGKTIFGQKRYDEYESFLLWLSDTIQEKKIDVLLVAGDIFDTSTPSNRAQELYYKFLCRTASSPCRHVVITAGNHDSPTFLDAPRELLRTLNVHVTGSVSGDPHDEIITLKNKNGEVELIVCAIPYLRDRDIRTVENGETVEDKERKISEGISLHYKTVCSLAEQKRSQTGKDIPVVCMGHLFTAGGKTVNGDGVRELYIGNLAHITASIFPETIDYLALGHLHVPQTVGRRKNMRYSGSPLPVGFSETKHQKSVCMVEFSGKKPHVSLLNVPVFQHLETVTGDWNHIQSRILELAALNSNSWLEINYESNEIISDLRERLENIIDNTDIKILRIRNRPVYDQVLSEIESESLDDLSVHDVFKRCLEINEIPPEQHDQLLSTYQETLNSLYEEDKQAQ